jgi:hypothetical protein
MRKNSRRWLLVLVVVVLIQDVACSTDMMKSVELVYNPAYNSTYEISIPTSLTVSDSNTTSLTISVTEWTDFPKGKAIIMTLSEDNTMKLINSSLEIPLEVYVGTSQYFDGDQIASYCPGSVALSGSTSINLAVITIRIPNKPESSVQYTGYLLLEFGTQ